MTRRVYLGIGDSIFLIVFNLVFFLATGSEHLASVWIPYAFLHVAYILFFLTPLFVKREKVFSLSLGVFSSVHFIAQLAVAIIFIVIEPDNYILPLLINVVLLALYLVALFSTLSVNQKDDEHIAYIDTKKAFINDCAATLKNAYDICSDTKSAQVINRAYYAVHSSPVVSSAEVENIEAHIFSLTNSVYATAKNNQFEQAVAYANEVIKEIEKRNNILKSIRH